MKRYIILCLIFCAGASMALAQKANQGCRVIGNISGTRTDTLLAFTFNEQLRGLDARDTILLKNGKFDFTLKSNKVKTIVFVNFPQPGYNFGMDKERMNLIVMPGVPLYVEGTLTNHKIWGSKTYKAMDGLLKPFSKESAQLNTEMQAKYEKAANKDSIRKAFEAKYESFRNKCNNYALTYIKAHPDNEESATLLPWIKNIDEGINLLSDRVKNGVMKDYYMPFKLSADNERMTKEAASKIKDGTMAPDFTIKDIKGNDFRLSSLRGKYVLLDFWGSWCHWCIKGMPELKKYYAKYSGKFEIVGVDCNDTEQKWKAAVEKNQLPWIHVKSETANSVSSKYGVEGYPTLVIIAPDGKIVKKFLGEDPEFFTTLDNMFK